MFTATQSRVARQIARLRRFMAEVEDAHRHMTEIKTGLPYAARERRGAGANKRGPAGPHPDEVV